MSDNQITEGGEIGAEASGKFQRPRRVWIVGAAVFGGIILLMLFRDRMDVGGDILTQYRFEALVDSGQILHATINYNARGSALNEVGGRYFKIENGAKVEVPFRARVRLTGDLERRLLNLPQFEPHEPNTVVLSVLLSVLPIIVIAVLIWFFFIRQIRRVARNSPSTPDLQARTSEQQTRFDRILDTWEAQARRMDAVLDKMERDTGVKR
jgi:ATP-dependent Zn protease